MRFVCNIGTMRDVRYCDFFCAHKKHYFAATDEKGGGITSNAKIFENDKHLWKPTVHQMDEYAEQSSKMLKTFFQERRKKD